MAVQIPYNTCCELATEVSEVTHLLGTDPTTNCEVALVGTYPGIPVDKNGSVGIFNGSAANPIILPALQEQEFLAWDTLLIKQADGTLTALEPPNDGKKYVIHSLNGEYFFSLVGGSGLEAVTGGFTGVELAAGKTVYMRIKSSGTVTKWTVLADPGASGSTTLDVWIDTFANYAPEVTETMIGAGTKPNITASDKGEDATVDWDNKIVTAGDVIAVNVDSTSGHTFANFSIEIRT